MKVWGAGDVDAASAGTLRVGQQDLVTPLARERARELGIDIVLAAPNPPAPPVSPPPAAPPSRNAPPAARPPSGRGSVPAMRPPSGALFRRGAPLPQGLAAGGGGTGRVIVVGAGHVGMITALRLAGADLFDEIVLVDIDEGRAAGVALDLAHTAALGCFATRVRGTGAVEDAGPADYVVITAGRPRQPGMSRSDLVSTNAAIVGDLAQRVARTSPDAVIVVVTNPLDEMTQHAWRSSGFPAERVVGMAGVLDTARFQALSALAGAGRADGIDAVALGSHGEEMVIPLSQARSGARPLTELVDRAALDAVVDRSRGSGAEVVGLLKTGSAFMAPGMSAARMVLAMARDTGEVMPAAVLADGTYGIRDVYVGLPVRLGRGGVREIVELDLTPDELSALRDAATRIKDRLRQLAAVS
ncbi:malate dehydrogenase [Amycolatopsis rubida]|uniref:Malate dehydrogenase n=1 Tax=Amycolatopsis rubida TaxID=112413 RepID=A0A1I5VGI0_9PSEU|nr:MULTISPECIES: malate dehydrogenase [Amycolatopsis]MYW89327.1 malate dehydrogenase [Amycolatopsis rubida]NEC54305.1 malate dehydrogenase [Amycolatopsis rubida]OAP21076.1 Malate dehydrogenase [Amycolatopsis sp. M39]SFQ06615.1 malate dehydrogenase [Amycolatopsis rubida]